VRTGSLRLPFWRVLSEPERAPDALPGGAPVLRRVPCSVGSLVEQPSLDQTGAYRNHADFSRAGAPWKEKAAPCEEGGIAYWPKTYNVRPDDLFGATHSL
jgi:hypothetical protein